MEQYYKKRNYKENEIWTNCIGYELRCGENQEIILWIKCRETCYKAGCECPAFLRFHRASNGNCVRKKDCLLGNDFSQISEWKNSRNVVLLAKKLRII
uniref:TIL domain-containing protein n=1 Tax=Onchocerca volvulus TaxID=6282 RepID=A0A8R1TZE8_ONCVO